MFIKQMSYSVGDDFEISWISKEIAGYEESDELPEYRQIHAPVKLLAESPFHRSQTLSLERLEYNDVQEVAESFRKVNTVYDRQPLLMIETAWNEIRGTFGECEISAMQLGLLEEWFKPQLNPECGRITRGWHEIPKVAINNIFNSVKFKALDILNHLERNYPCLNQETMDDKNNVVISGNHNPVNIITGNNNVINSHFVLTDEIKQRLHHAGVDEKETERLENIIDSEPPKSTSLKTKINGWLRGLAITADIATISQILMPLL
ncbi:MAG: hypothetical protein NC453_12440 [Muribaculum sp.]|nr:hypothetical protein [Muribaculum sp.]